MTDETMKHVKCSKLNGEKAGSEGRMSPLLMSCCHKQAEMSRGFTADVIPRRRCCSHANCNRVPKFK